MKKEWNQPLLEILDVSMTLGGPGRAINDSYCTNNQDFETHEDMSNESNMCS
ncbi:paeninodin family lasso peptide [Oceanobacillus sp. CF4.6]|uniref:paeninodin family lasso peptide n=1 Tax=Oceanobacillus sp. CF4.6 TaxID=3373080 RepID=UPI003EE5C395